MNFIKKKLLKRKPIRSNFDVFNTNTISGWVYKENEVFDEIRFLIGDNLISTTKINISRNDVNQALKIPHDLKLGFSIKLNKFEKSKSQKCIEPRLIVLKNDGSCSYDILKIKKYISFKEKLKLFIENNIIGSQGFVEGIIDNKYICGWAYKNGDENSKEIWIHCNSLGAKIKILCNSETQKGDLNLNSGFSYPIEDIPKIWINKKITLTFDKKGLYKIPGNSEFILNQFYFNLEDNEQFKIDKTSEDNDVLVLKNLSSEEFIKSWENLEKSKFYLDLVSKHLDKIEIKSKSKMFLKRFFKR